MCATLFMAAGVALTPMFGLDRLNQESECFLGCLPELTVCMLEMCAKIILASIALPTQLTY